MFRKVFINWRSPLLLHTNKRFFFTPPKYDSKKNYYAILEVNQAANDAQLKKAYYRLARDYHPDHNKGHQAKFKEINEAYEILSDPKERKGYDRTRDLFSLDLDGVENPENIDFEEYQRRFYQMSPEEQKQAKRKVSRGLLKILFILGSIFYITYSFAAWIFRSIKNLFHKQQEATVQRVPNESKQQLNTPKDFIEEQKCQTENMPVNNKKTTSPQNQEEKQAQNKISKNEEQIENFTSAHEDQQAPSKQQMNQTPAWKNEGGNIEDQSQKEQVKPSHTDEKKQEDKSFGQSERNI